MCYKYTFKFVINIYFFIKIKVSLKYFSVFFCNSRCVVTAVSCQKLPVAQGLWQHSCQRSEVGLLHPWNTPVLKSNVFYFWSLWTWNFILKICFLISAPQHYVYVGVHLWEVRNNYLLKVLLQGLFAPGPTKRLIKS